MFSNDYLLSVYIDTPYIDIALYYATASKTKCLVLYKVAPRLCHC